MPVKAVVNTVAQYSILNPKHNIKVQLDGQVVEAALVKFAYKPLAEGQTGPKRDNPTKMVPASTWNYWQYMPFRNGHHQAYTKKNIPIPTYVVLVEDVDKYVGARLLQWNGQFMASQEELDAMTVLGALSGEVKDGVYVTGLDYVAMEAAVAQAVAEGNLMVVDSVAPAEDILPVEAAADAPYTGDAFTKDPETGHYIGDDGFRVPRDFAEFIEWHPHYIENWTKRRLGRNAQQADIEDWAADLTMHLWHLPETSKHRLAGKFDVIMTFDPIRQYGASERRFRSYINRCLENRFSTIMSKKQKNPICRMGNLSLATVMDPDNYEVVDDEYVHSHSEVLTNAATRTLKNEDDSVFASQLYDFVADEDPSLLPVMKTLMMTGTQGEAARDLNMTEQELSRARNRLKVLGQCLRDGEIVPKQRKPYKKRGAAAE